jgi:hypothetical protein
MAYSLASPNGIAEPVDLEDLLGWFAKELMQLPEAERRVLETVANDLDAFIRWPTEALPFWPGCHRNRTHHPSYPAPLGQMAKAQGIDRDRRSNGPAIVSFLIAGGERPTRRNSTHGWDVHHLYSEKFPYYGRPYTTHARMSGEHFTQSAGLIAAHPIAHTVADEFPCFAWLLRAKAFHLFG